MNASPNVVPREVMVALEALWQAGNALAAPYVDACPVECRGDDDSADVSEGRLARGAAPVLVDATEAARLLGITSEALYQRVSRRQVPGVVRTGRRIQFHRGKLLEGIERRARR